MGTLKEGCEGSCGGVCMVQLFNDMTMTVKLLGEVFPWLAPSVHFSDEKCDIGHANRSPPNPCGDKALPPHPDAATKKLIQKYNHLDIELYKIGVQRFMRQKKMLEIKSKKSSS